MLSRMIIAIRIECICALHDGSQMLLIADYRFGSQSDFIDESISILSARMLSAAQPRALTDTRTLGGDGRVSVGSERRESLRSGKGTIGSNPNNNCG